MFDILADFGDFNVLSTAHDGSLESYKTILSYFSRLFEKSDNDHDDIVRHWLLDKVSDLNKHNLDEATE